MKNKHKLIRKYYPNAIQYVLKSKNKRIEVLKGLEKNELCITVKRLRKDFVSGGHFGVAFEKRGLMGVSLNMTHETARELIMLLNHFCSKEDETLR